MFCCCNDSRIEIFLFFCSHVGYVDIVKFLLTNGVEDGEGKAPLQIARENGNNRINVPTFNATNPEAFFVSYAGFTDIAEFLLEHGAAV